LFLHPLLLMDEAVSLAVAVCILVYRDNRTMTDERLRQCGAWQRVRWTRLLDSDPHDATLPWQGVSGTLPRARVLHAAARTAPRRSGRVPAPPPVYDPWGAVAAAEQEKYTADARAALRAGTASLKRRSRSRSTAAAVRPSDGVAQVKRLLAAMHKHQRWHHGLHRNRTGPLLPPAADAQSYSFMSSSP
jgi:hypothetical protein